MRGAMICDTICHLFTHSFRDVSKMKLVTVHINSLTVFSLVSRLIENLDIAKGILVSEYSDQPVQPRSL